MQATLHDSPGMLVFYTKDPFRNSNGVTYSGRQMHVGYVKISDF